MTYCKNPRQISVLIINKITQNAPDFIKLSEDLFISKKEKLKTEQYEHSGTHLLDLTDVINILPHLLRFLKQYFEEHYAYHGILHPNRSIFILQK